MTSGWHPSSLDRRPAMIIAGILLAGLIGLDLWYFLFGHELVRRMYFGESLPVFNRIIEGQHSTPLGEYWKMADIYLAFASVGAACSLGLLLTFMRMGLRVCLGAMSALGVLLAVVSTSHYGAALFPDTANYISAAVSLVEGEGYVNFNGTVYASWPPLLPTLLAPFALVKIDIESAIRFFNAVVFGLLIFASSTYYRNNIRSERLILVATGATLLAMPLLTIAVAATADLLFALFVVLSMLSWQRLSLTGKVVDLMGFSAMVSLACLTRYAGLPLIAGGFVLILLFVPQRRWGVRLAFALGFVVAASTPLVLWMVRNYHLTATVSGGRCSAENVEILRGVYYALNVLSTWFMSGGIGFFIRIGILGLMVTVAVTALWFGGMMQSLPESNRWRELAPPFIMSVLYTCFLVLYTAMEPDYNITNRLLAPVYPLVVCLVLAGAEGCLSRARSGMRGEIGFGRILAGTCLVLWLGYSFISLEGKVASCLLTGTGEFSTVAWRESALMKWMKDHPLDGDIYSNAADAIYLLADRKAMFMPHQSRGIKDEKDAKEFEANLSKQKSTYFVWFEAMNTRSLHSAESLSLVVPLECYRTFGDGAIYRYVGNHSNE